MSAEQQHPIGSGFHAKSTAQEVLSGIDLRGKNVIITGGYSGIGLEAVKALSKAGAHVTVPARRPDAATAALEGISDGIEIAAMDLADIQSVTRFAQDYVSSGRSLDILINNAGIMACPEARVGPGWESQFGINHLGHMALFLDLLPALRAANGARVVALSSAAHAMSDVHWDDPHFTSHAYDKWQAYGQAKTANALFALGVNLNYARVGIRAFSVHPGGIFTPLQRHLPDEEMVMLGWKNADGSIPDHIRDIFKTPEQGASTTVWAATSPSLADKGGLYCEDADIAQLASDTSQPGQHVQAWACSPESAEKLWNMSLAMLAD